MIESFATLPGEGRGGPWHPYYWASGWKGISGGKGDCALTAPSRAPGNFCSHPRRLHRKRTFHPSVCPISCSTDCSTVDQGPPEWEISGECSGGRAQPRGGRGAPGGRSAAEGSGAAYPGLDRLRQRDTLLSLT